MLTFDVLIMYIYSIFTLVLLPLGSTDHRLFSIFTGLFEFFADLCLCLGAWKASVMLHNYMAGNVFRNPMRFFDATPTGRILSRFSSDVEVIDHLYQQISDTIYCFMDVRFILFL